MASANKDDADRCINIAQAALQAGDLAKAKRFAEKAVRLFPSEEASLLLKAIATSQTTSTQQTQPAASDDSTSELKYRRTNSSSSQGTAAQAELVARIRKCKTHYEVLSISEDATEEEIKKAYKTLALKLHPDKNRAQGADEAFKLVSGAFACLSDADKRADYDRRRTGVYQRGEPAGFSNEIDPEELFNMFFGTAFGAHPRGRMFHHMRPNRAAQQQQQDTTPSPLGYLMHLLPLLLLLALTFLSSPGEKPFSLDSAGEYRQAFHTKRYNVPYFVKSTEQFNQKYPEGTRDRQHMENKIELEYKDRLENLCYNERLRQLHLMRMGYTDRAKKVELKSCDEISQRFGYKAAYAY